MFLSSKQKRIIEYLRQHLAQLATYGQHQPQDDASAVEDRFNGLVDLAKDEVRSVQQLILRPQRLGLPEHQKQQAAQRILIQLLNQVDRNGRSFYAILRARKVAIEIKICAVNALADRNDPALLLPLTEWLKPKGGQDGLLARLFQRTKPAIDLDEPALAILEQLGRHGVTEARPLIEELDRWIAVNSAVYDRSRRVPLVTAHAQLGGREALRLLIDWAVGNYLVLGDGSAMSAPDGLKRAIASRGGVANVVADLATGLPAGRLNEQLGWLMEHGASDAIRRWARIELVQLGSVAVVETALHLLGSEDWATALQAVYLLQEQLTPTQEWRDSDPQLIDRLRALAADEQAERSRRLWAVYTLFTVDHDATALWEGIPAAHAPAPAGVPAAVQQGIATYWYPDPGFENQCTGTDICLLIEGKRTLLLDPAIPRVEMSDELRDQQRSAYQLQLQQAGFTDAQVARTVGCYLVNTGGYAFLVSVAGTFCCAAWPTYWLSLLTSAPLVAPAMEIRGQLEKAGFLWLDEATLDVRLENFAVDTMGTNDPSKLAVRDLLFFNAMGDGY